MGKNVTGCVTDVGEAVNVVVDVEVGVGVSEMEAVPLAVGETVNVEVGVGVEDGMEMKVGVALAAGEMVNGSVGVAVEVGVRVKVAVAAEPAVMINCGACALSSREPRLMAVLLSPPSPKSTSPSPFTAAVTLMVTHAPAVILPVTPS